MAVTRDTPIAERFREVVAATPDAIALTFSPRTAGVPPAVQGVRYTYAEIDQWSDAIAADLLARQAPLDQPVAIVTRDPVALVPAVLGVVKAGHYFVVIDASDPHERVSSLMSAANASCVLEICDPATRVKAAATLPHSPAHEWVQVLFTSGTTGVPKAVLSPQRGFVERVVAQSSLTGRAAGERVSYTALPGFARATYEILGSLLNGATLCAFDARSESLDALGTLIERERITILTLTPALFRRFMKTVPADLDLSSVKKLRIGADVVTPADVEAYKARFPRPCTLERGFNATETGMVMHISINHDTPIPGPLVPIGRPRPNVHVRVVGEDGNDVADDETGELIVRSSFIVADGETYATGDLVKRDTDGLYYFVGRMDSRLKIHGRRIDPLEVESALVAYSGAREAVAVGKPGPDGESHLVAYVVMPADRPFIPREIRAALRDKLPAPMIPSHLYALDAIPMTGSGKVDRAALTARVEVEPAGEDDASDDLERTLIEIWSRVTGRTVRVDDDYFDDLGGESVAAAHLVTEVHRALGRSMPLSLLLELNTVAKMADYLRSRGEADLERTAILVQQGTDERPPLFCVSGKGGSVIVFRQLAALLGPGQTFYGLTHHGFAREAFPKTFAALAACYMDAIRAVQPEGPYFVAGYSAGALIAFDVARQLSRAGQKVPFVGIIDASPTPQHVPSWKRYAKLAVMLREKPMNKTKRYARSLARRAMGLLRRPAPPPVQENNRLFDSIERRGMLQPYEGRVTLFLARHGWGFDGSTSDLGWRALCQELDIMPVEGEHQTVIRNDVASLASAMTTALIKAR